MWGNWQGWTISALIVALFAGAVFLIDHAAGVVTSPTAFSADERNFAEIAFIKPPFAHLEQELSSDVPQINDPEAYMKTIGLLEESPSQYERFAESGKLDDNTKSLKAISAVKGLLYVPTRPVFASKPDMVITYAHAKPAIDSMRLLGKIYIDRIGLLSARAGSTQQAHDAYLAGATMGFHLAQERLTYDEYQLGQELLSKASAAIASLAEQTNKVDEAAEWRAFDVRRVAENKLHIDPVLKLVRSIDANTVGPHAGDLFELAKRSRERMWRVEAILAIGRMRYFAGAGGTAANQRAANALLRDLADHDPDPIIRTAAETARDLTIEQYRMQ